VPTAGKCLFNVFPFHNVDALSPWLLGLVFAIRNVQDDHEQLELSDLNQVPAYAEFFGTEY
jgi:hypothetical protein